MCGLYGFLHYGDNKIKYLSNITNALAQEAAVRGTDATGIAFNDKGRLSILKESKSAYRLNFKHSDNISAVIGHTRHSTQGSEKKNYNNHPFSGRCQNTRFALAHNEVLMNDTDLRKQYRLPKSKIETDSYIAVQLLEHKKKLNAESIKFMAETVEGSFSFSILDSNNTIWLVKGDSPLSLIHFPDLKLYIYASTEEILWKALIETDLFYHLKNGVVNVTTREIYLHSCKCDFTSCINARYIPNASINNAPAFKQFCQTSLNGDLTKIKLLLQIIGYICSNYTTAKKAFMLIGKPNSGKSKIAEWLGNIIGEDNVSNVSFDKLGNRFNIAAFSRSKLNINAEMSLEPIKDISMFKSLIGGDKIQAEDKGKQPFTFSNKCKFLFAGNGLPVVKSQDTTEAFISRLVILYFPNSISEAERDLELSKKLYHESDIIFSLAVNELNELVESGFRFELPQEESEQLLEYKENSTHIESFIDDRCILSPELKSSTKTLYDAYINYCKDNCFTPYGMQTFAAAIRNSRNLTKTKITVNGIQSRGFKGIDIKQYYIYFIPRFRKQLHC